MRTGDDGRAGRARGRHPGPAPRRRGAVVVLGVAILFGACSSNDVTSTGAPPATGAPSSSTSPSSSPSGTSGTVAGTTPSSVLTLSSSAFADGGAIPLRYACDNQGGENASPPLAWDGVPAGTETLVLVVHDPDAPRPGGFTHLVTMIPTDVTELDDGANFGGSGPMVAWIGPCPPSGEHRYTFTLYAFGADVPIADDADKAAIDAVAGQALAQSTLTGLFSHRG